MHGNRWRNGLSDARERTSEPDRFGFDASSLERLGIMPKVAIRKCADPDPDAYGEERRIGPRSWAGSRRRRLPDQAVFSSRTARAHSRAFATNTIGGSIAGCSSLW